MVYVFLKHDQVYTGSLAECRFVSCYPELASTKFSNGTKCVFCRSIHRMSAFSTASSVVKELSVRLDAHNNLEVHESVAL